MSTAVGIVAQRLAPPQMPNQIETLQRGVNTTPPVWRAVSRYAAAITLAFVAGYSIRGQAQSDSGIAPDTVAQTTQQSTVQEKLALVHQEAPEASMLTKSFLAVIAPATNAQH